ncbi:BatD family protein [Marinobacter sp. F4206]|uniref:BatD family protein n=1 Tax=Marinobacter sp. F4206 TaxID=2861777 RepID=UPI001C5D971E|nr:BatD family protein [Marinobacter sp. F4206]MBW4935388.1 BatD family protein [Marinobacter sp. F4206]
MRWAGRPVLAALFLSGLAGQTLAAEVRIQTRLVPDADIRSGQTVSYEVDVLTDTWLTGTPEFRPLEVAGALVFFEGSQGRSIQRTIKGKRYFGVTYSYRLIPLEPGVRTLPSFRIEAPVGQEDAPVAVSTPERSFAVQPLPGVESSAISLLAADVRLSQSLSTAGASIVAGHPIVREIRVQAHQALALSIPPLIPSSTGAVAGTRLPADIRPVTNEGGWVTGGERIERIRYSPDQPGTYRLPALSITWWDIDDERIRQSTLPALPIAVLPGAGPSGSRGQTRWFLFMLAAGASMAILAGYRRAIRSRTRFFINRVCSRWQNSVPGRKQAAIQQIRGTPRELTGLYRLTDKRTGTHSLRHSPLNSRQREALLAGIAGYYATHPEPETSTRRLIPLIRKIKGAPRTDRGPHPAQLPPLNARQR